MHERSSTSTLNFVALQSDELNHKTLNMSEPKESQPPAMASESATTQNCPAPSAVQSHFELYTKFYSQAYRLATSPEANETNDDIQKHNQRILTTLATITKFVFGLDVTKKSSVVLHAAGALELIIALVQSSNTIGDDAMSKTIKMGALKAIKTCVVRNPAGRSRCRSAGVLTFINDVFDTMMLDDTNAVLVEEAFTTLAAVCLGDDLNALQASTDSVKPFIIKSKELFANASSMHQKTLYLETLFEAVEKEQVKLLQHVEASNGTASFFKDVVESETNIRTGYSHLQDEQYALAVKHYSDAMQLLSSFEKETSLLDEMMVEIRSKRACAALELGDAEQCLSDTSILLERKDTNAAEAGARVGLLKMHGKALFKAGRVEEAKETLAKLKIMCPQDNDVEVAELLNSLNVNAEEPILNK